MEICYLIIVNYNIRENRLIDPPNCYVIYINLQDTLWFFISIVQGRELFGL